MAKKTTNKNNKPLACHECLFPWHFTIIEKHVILVSIACFDLRKIRTNKTERERVKLLFQLKAGTQTKNHKESPLPNRCITADILVTENPLAKYAHNTFFCFNLCDHSSANSSRYSSKCIRHWIVDVVWMGPTSPKPHPTFAVVLIKNTHTHTHTNPSTQTNPSHHAFRFQPQTLKLCSDFQR